LTNACDNFLWILSLGLLESTKALRVICDIIVQQDDLILWLNKPNHMVNATPELLIPEL
jgi:hypothetical protein